MLSRLCGKNYRVIFLNKFCTQELREATAKEFVNLKGKMSVKEYAVKFTQLSLFAPEIESSMRSRMWKLVLDMSC